MISRILKYLIVDQCIDIITNSVISSFKSIHSKLYVGNTYKCIIVKSEMESVECIKFMNAYVTLYNGTEYACKIYSYELISDSLNSISHIPSGILVYFKDSDIIGIEQ
jgi:hypothetical protein